jgi:hypothetical protein
MVRRSMALSREGCRWPGRVVVNGKNQLGTLTRKALLPSISIGIERSKHADAIPLTARHRQQSEPS